MRKEATEKVIELHDDDADHFEFMLKYFYTVDMESVSLGFLDMLIKTFGLYTIADKYGCEGLGKLAVDEFEEHMADTPLTITVDMCELMIEDHYDDCVKSDCAMGKAIATCFLKNAFNPEDSTKLASLAYKYPGLGRDLVLVCLERDP